jgi:hypothetical protein
VVRKEKGLLDEFRLHNKEVFVKFKDYAFLFLQILKNEDVIISGKVYISVESVADLKHYAKDGGKSQAQLIVL